MSLGSSATITCAEGNCREPFPKPLGDRGRARAVFLAGITNIACTTLDAQRSRLHCAVHSHTSVPACQRKHSAEQIPAVYMLKICGCMRHRPQTPKYPIILANEAAQYLSTRNLQVPLIFPTVWCLVLTAGKRVVDRKAHLRVQDCLKSSDKTAMKPRTKLRQAGEACRRLLPLAELGRHSCLSLKRP